MSQAAKDEAKKDIAEAGESAPVPGDQQPERESRYGVSLAWTALTPGRAMDAVFAMNSAGDFDQFRAAAQLLDSPAQNLVYADVDGHIGYQTPGRIPVRAGA